MFKRLTARVYKIKNSYATVSRVKGVNVYGEKIFKKGSKELRVWNPKKSKIAAAMMKGMPLKYIDLLERYDAMLYLGIANGTTASHFSDIAKEDALIYGVELSPRSIIDLSILIEQGRRNIVPILANASYWEHYAPYVEQADILYVDIAQPNQTDIALLNADIFLKDQGYLYLAIKTRSISITKKPIEVIKDEISKIKQHGYNIEFWTRLDPFEKDHGFVIARKQ
ncbi:MAG: fibrillarin-like rRNA/tRNA 2'-O-methyltransferase [Candidatus Nanohaloarchaeota archaeon]|nr:fibrillarin-like rRNA/tRNA 2'-O-methyltransferase [Candidatus Nanohaloarchaeota archaeon]